MGYSKIDAVEYKIIWVREDRSTLALHPYMISHDSDEGLTIENSKISLRLKLIKDKPLDNGTYAPFFSSNIGYRDLSTASILKIFVKYSDGVNNIDTNSNDDLLGTYIITDWDLDEPSGNLSINAVDLSYKITNKIISRTYSQVDENTTGFTATGTTLTDGSKNFPTGQTLKFQEGYKYMTLELIDTSGNIHLLLITANTATTCTTHKTIPAPVGAWAEYRIGWNSPLAILDSMKRTAIVENGQGEAFTQVQASLTTDLQDNYVTGIQLLRRVGANPLTDTEAFPIINIGEAYMPVYKLINECSSYAACNKATELTTKNPPILRDMIFVIVWDDLIKKNRVNWFYADTPTRGDVKSITAVVANQISTSTPSVNDVGKLMRIKMVRDTATFYKTYSIIAVSGNNYTVEPDPLIDGITTLDTFNVYGGSDFVWDNEEDFKHIYSIKLGSRDEERFNHVLFDAGKNEVSNRNILGHWFNERTESDTLKETFIPMTDIAKGMILYEKAQGHIRLQNDLWEGYDTGAMAFTSNPADWDFSTTFGLKYGTYVVTSRTTFNVHFKTAARLLAKERAGGFSTKQKENTLQGTIQIRGQKFITVSSGSQIQKWYQKGTRILFKRPESALNNRADKYYILIVTKVRQQINSARWITSMDVEYDLYNTTELI